MLCQRFIAYFALFASRLARFAARFSLRDIFAGFFACLFERCSLLAMVVPVYQRRGASAMGGCCDVETLTAAPIRPAYAFPVDRLLKPLLIVAGTASVGVGVLGIFLPLLPTTPFLLLAAACYARSSPRLYRWLHENRWFGEYLTNYRAGHGLPLRGKIITLAMLWLAIGISIILVEYMALRLLLAAIALGVTIHLVRMKTFIESAGEQAASEHDLGYSTNS